MTRRGGLSGLVLAALTACGSHGVDARPPPSTAPPPKLPPPLVRAPREVPASWSHWEPVEPIIPAGALRAPTLPIDKATLERDALGAALGENARAKLKLDGLVVTDGDAATTQVGAFYAALDPRAGWMITVDALAIVVRGALDAALAEVEERVLKASLATLITRLEARLAELGRSPGAEMAEPLDVARGVVAVARALTGETLGLREPPGLSRALKQRVAAERALIEAHDGVAPSPVLGVALDYSEIGVERAPPERLPIARAFSWLGSAPLMLASVAELKVSPADVAMARAHTRAAMVLTALLAEDEGDRDASAAYTRISRYLGFVYGTPDDVTPAGLRLIADRAKVRVEAPDDIADVTKVDRVRRLAVSQSAPRAWDGAGDVEVPPRPLQASTSVPRAALGFRVFGGHAARDAAALQALVFPSVGALEGGGSPATARAGRRVLPCMLDVAAWLGAKEAEVAVRESGDDAYVGFVDMRARLVAARPGPRAPERHASLNDSALDLLFSYVAPTASRVRPPSSAAFERLRVESALAAWLHLARVAPPFAREPALSAPPVRTAVASEAVAFVEPHPEAIGALLALVRQAQRGLGSLGLDAKGPGALALVAIERVVDIAFLASARLARDEALTTDERVSLSFVPAELRALEKSLGSRARVSRSTDVHADLSGGRALVAGSGPLERAWIAVPEPATGTTRIVVAPHAPMYEKVVPLPERAQIGWRSEITRAQPRRLTIAASFRAP
ncbi:MAG: DUF3160 domain-containing protein [Polyangiaceae bacterium]